MNCFLLFIIWSTIFTTTGAYDPLDPKGNITITWNIRYWTSDGYVAEVKIINFQQFRQIQSPGWQLGWTWPKNEIIWDIRGAETTEQSDCSKFKSELLPHSCSKMPTVIDLLPGSPLNYQVSNCCKGGVITSWAQDPGNAVSSFKITVGQSGTTTRTVRPPVNITLKVPGSGYSCGEAKDANSSTFLSPNKRRKTQALKTWNITCTHSLFSAHTAPSCCVSMSSFYNKTITPCTTCSCGCQDGTCVDPDGASVAPDLEPYVQCTRHMCPIRVHWHLMKNYREYWRVKVTITNFKYNVNYSQWNLVVQHPNFENLTEIYSFNQKPLNPYTGINDTAMLWGIDFFNNMLMQAGPKGYVQSEILFRKDQSQFTLEKGWGFPRSVYFNGDRCVMPSPVSYPMLPNASPVIAVSSCMDLIIILFSLFMFM